MVTMPNRLKSSGEETIVKVLGANISIRRSGDDVLDYLEGIGLRAKDMQTPLDRFGRYLVEQHIPRQFAQQGTPKRWAALNKQYAAWKRRRYGNLPKLVLSGAMRKGFKWEVTARTLKVINRVKSGQKGRGVPRWQYHQRGTDNMPARPMLQITEKDRDMLRELAQDWILFETGGGVL